MCRICVKPGKRVENCFDSLILMECKALIDQEMEEKTSL